MKNKITCSSFLAVFLLSLFVCIGDANAQNVRRRKNSKPRVVSAVQPLIVAPEIARDVYLDGNQIVLGENLSPSPEAANEPETPPKNQTVETNGDPRIGQLTERIKSLESTKNNDYDAKQKRLALNLDILTKAENRAESLRKQLFEMIEKESGVQTRLEQIRYDARPETIERSTAFVGSMRPEEIREQRKKSLDAEKKNLETLLTQIQTSRSNLEENVSKADFLVEKVRLKLDKDIDDALSEKEENQ